MFVYIFFASVPHQTYICRVRFFVFPGRRRESMIDVKGGPVQLVLAQRSDAQLIHGLKREAFLPLYEIYRDDETSPVMDTVDKVVCQLAQEDTDYWLIVYEGRMVGGVRVVRKKDANLISPMFVLPEEQNKGIGSAVLEQLFQMYPETFCWRLVTIQEEERNCHLYEKMGFCNTLSARKVSGNMTLIGYEKFFKESSGEG